MRSYQPDILGNHFEQLKLQFPDDYEGKVIATLIRRKALQPTFKAVLYIHGFNDYFFQQEMAEKFNDNHIDFYALDLRKYGRSWMPHQKLNNVRKLEEYYPEMRKALDIIVEEQHNEIYLIGHSTAGLTVTNFIADHPNECVKGLILNSPFFDFNFSYWEKNLKIPMGSLLANFFPDIKIDTEMNERYGKSLHRKFQGEWDYNLVWKPIIPPKINISFIHAVFNAQKRFRRGVHIHAPILLMSSSKSCKPEVMNEDVFTSDIILDVKDIQAGAKYIHGDVVHATIRNGIHDLFLSRKKAQDEAYREVFKFIESNHTAP